MTDRAKAALVRPKMTIKEVMAIIADEPKKCHESPGGIALVVNDDNHLIGILTDGDIRRAIVGGADLGISIEKIYNKNPVTFSKNLTPTEMLTQTVEVIKQRNFPSGKLNIILTVDENNRPHDVFHFFELWRKAEVKTRVVSVIGLGYVGLTLGLVLADSGFKVIGVDKDKALVKNLQRGKNHIYEKGLENILERHLNKNFFVQNNFDNNESDVYIICVGTSVRNEKVEFGPLKESLVYLNKILKKEDLVVLRSTVPVGTCSKIVIPALEKTIKMKVGEDFYVAFAPERTLEGAALSELRSLPQVIGGYDKKSADLAVRLFNNISNSIVLVDNLESAEMVKLLNNTYRDLTFSFANETALICDKYNLNCSKIIQAANFGYERSAIPKPSPGVGGYCLSKDPFILIDSAKKVGHKAELPLIARKINARMIDYVVGKVDNFIKIVKRKNPKIFIIGLAFKGEPETADMRNSTALEISLKLRKKYRNVLAYDPVVKKENIKKTGLKFSEIKAGFYDADCVLILNDHKSYLNLDLNSLLKRTKKPVLFFDAWHIFGDHFSKPTEGIVYRGI